MAIEDEIARAEEKLLTCLQTLGTQEQRQYDKKNVQGLGRLVALEDVWVRGRHFRIAIEGLAYSGKTEVGSALARRLSHAYLNTQAIARAIANFVSERKAEGIEFKTPAASVHTFFEEPVVFEARDQSPYYFLQRGAEDLTHVVHASSLDGDLLFDDDAFEVLRNRLSDLLGEAGLVVEGPRAREILKGRVHAFYISASPALRKARLIDHQHALHHSEAEGALEKLDLKTRALEERTRVDNLEWQRLELADRSAPEASLILLRTLLPNARRPALSGGKT